MSLCNHVYLYNYKLTMIILKEEIIGCANAYVVNVVESSSKMFSEVLVKPIIITNKLYNEVKMYNYLKEKQIYQLKKLIK